MARKHINPVVRTLSKLYDISYDQAAKAYFKCNKSIPAAQQFIFLFIAR